MRCAQNVLAIILVSPLFAEKLPIQAYTTADGLANNHINRIRSDSRGFLWICTDEGLSRFEQAIHSRLHRSRWTASPSGERLYWKREPGAYWWRHPMAAYAGTIRQVNSALPCIARARGQARHGSTPSWRALMAISGVEPTDGLYRMVHPQGQEVRFVREEIGAPADFYEGSLINSIFLDSRKTLWAASRSGSIDARMVDRGNATMFHAKFPMTFLRWSRKIVTAGYGLRHARRGVCSLIPDPKQAGTSPLAMLLDGGWTAIERRPARLPVAGQAAVDRDRKRPERAYVQRWKGAFPELHHRQRLKRIRDLRSSKRSSTAISGSEPKRTAS